MPFLYFSKIRKKISPRVHEPTSPILVLYYALKTNLMVLLHVIHSGHTFLDTSKRFLIKFPFLISTTKIKIFEEFVISIHCVIYSIIFHNTLTIKKILDWCTNDILGNAEWQIHVGGGRGGCFILTNTFCEDCRHAIYGYTTTFKHITINQTPSLLRTLPHTACHTGCSF